MGLLNELNTINRTLENNQRQLTKSEIREVERIKKERLKNMFLENFSELFSYCKDSADIESLEINLIKNKSQNILFIQDNYNELYKNKTTESDINYMDQFYYKWMQESKKEYNIVIKAEEKQVKQQNKLEEVRQDTLRKQAIQQQQARQELLHGIAKAFYIIALILAAPFLFLGLFIIGILKNVK